MNIQECRPVVQLFAMAMEARLRKNDRKAGWGGMTFHQLRKRLREESVELMNACLAEVQDNVLEEAADVANFAMFTADNAGALVEAHPYRQRWVPEAREDAADA